MLASEFTQVLCKNKRDFSRMIILQEAAKWEPGWIYDVATRGWPRAYVYYWMIERQEDRQKEKRNMFG